MFVWKRGMYMTPLSLIPFTTYQAALVAVVSLLTQQPQPIAAAEGNGMPYATWEYLAMEEAQLAKYKDNFFTGWDTEGLNGDVTKALWCLGSEGWELITVLPATSPAKRAYYFKRPAGTGLPSKPKIRDPDNEDL